MGVKLWLSFVFATLMIGYGESMEIYNCLEAEVVCIQGDNVTDIEGNEGLWIINFGNWMLEYYPYYRAIVVANSKLNLAATYSRKYDIMMFQNAETKSVIIDTFEGAYLIPVTTVPMSFATPVDMWQTIKRVYYETIIPFLYEIKCSTDKQNKKFNLRNLLTYLYEHESISGLPDLSDRGSLEADLDQYFGKIFTLVHEGYKDNTLDVSDYESVFYSLIMDNTTDHQTLYKYIMSIAVNRQPVSSNIVNMLHDGVTQGNYSEFAEYRNLYGFAKYLYRTIDEASEAKKNDTFEETKVTTTCDETEFSISFARDISSRNYVINIKNNDGKINIYIMYNTDSWTFYCGLTKYMLIFPQGQNFGLYNFEEGVGIVVSKKTGFANIVKHNSEEFKKYSAVNDIIPAIEKLVEYIRDADIIIWTNDMFSFNNFIQNSYYTGNVSLTLTSTETRMILRTYFNTFITDFKSISGYEKDDRVSNSVLYFFQNICISGMREDFRSMVQAIGTRDSSLNSGDLITAIYESYFDMLTKEEE